MEKLKSDQNNDITRKTEELKTGNKMNTIFEASKTFETAEPPDKQGRISYSTPSKSTLYNTIQHHKTPYNTIQHHSTPKTNVNQKQMSTKNKCTNNKCQPKPNVNQKQISTNTNVN